MKIATAVTCAPRPGADYLPSSLEAIRRAGFDPPVVVAEPDCVIPAGVRAIVRNDRSLGPWPNFLKAMRFLLAARLDADAFAIFQDDIDLTPDIARRFWWPDDPARIGAVSLYSCAAQSGNLPDGVGGWRLIVPRESEVLRVREGADTVSLRSVILDSWGALALILPRSSAEALVLAPPGAGTRTRTDFWVGRHCVDRGLGYYASVPSLCQHLGEISAVQAGFAENSLSQYRRASYVAESWPHG